MDQSCSSQEALGLQENSDLVAYGQFTGCVYILIIPIKLIFYTYILCTVTYMYVNICTIFITDLFKHL